MLRRGFSRRRRAHLFVQIPDEALEAVLKDRGRSRRAPDLVRPVRAVEAAAKESVEAAHVVHVEVREAKVVEVQQIACGQRGRAAFAAIEEHPFDRLSAVDLDV